MDGKIRRITKPDNRLARLNKSMNEKEANINKKLVLTIKKIRFAELILKKYKPVFLILWKML